MSPDDFEISGRQLSGVAACAAMDEKTLKFMVREVIAIKNGWSQGVQLIEIRSPSVLASAATLSTLVKLHRKTEFAAVTSAHIGNDMTTAD